jgi:O-acetyl-ADP-ribose deacetylase (regulator of RNase III)
MERLIMIREETGNLLQADVDALVNTVNTVGVMGKGIALQFRRAYPEMYKVYERAAKTGGLQLGQMQVWETGAFGGPRFIINFPTKQHWRSPSRLSEIEDGLQDLVRVIRERGITSIAVPPLGCGNGGLDWRDVAPRIWHALAPLADDVDILVYPPNGAPPAAEIVSRNHAPRMTPARAALVKMMEAYQSISLDAPSLIEVQKLVYFLQEAGEGLRLEFTKGHYGPYADNLRKTLREIEGHFILGFGDGSASVFDAEPLRVVPDAVQKAEDVLSVSPETAYRIERVLKLAEGFESMYGLELLASVHWVVRNDDSASLGSDRAIELVQRWTKRKERIFTADHITTAWRVLLERGWLSAVPG